MLQVTLLLRPRERVGVDELAVDALSSVRQGVNRPFMELGLKLAPGLCRDMMRLIDEQMAAELGHPLLYFRPTLFRHLHR
jgi:hypothetical protein